MNLLKATFEDSFIPQVITDTCGVIIEVNDQACHTIKKSRDKLIGSKHVDLTDEEFDVLQGLASTFESNNLQNWQTEQKYVRGDGTVLWVCVNVSAVRNEDRVENLLLQLQDITPHKLAEEELRQNTKDLEQFVYIASHDLREPLTSIAGFASLFRKKYEKSLDETGMKYIGQMLDSAKRMESKIDDLLNFSRAGRAVALHNTFSLGAAIEEAKRALVRSIAESQATFEIPEKLPLLLGERSMIAQVFQNLFSNSIKYRGSKPPVIQVEAEPHDDNYWLIIVKDNGIGFDMRYKDRIFDVFHRLYTVEQYPGTGIGLAIVKKVVERHRGRIWTLSEPGKGSSFYLTLPSVPQS